MYCNTSKKYGTSNRKHRVPICLFVFLFRWTHSDGFSLGLKQQGDLAGTDGKKDPQGNIYAHMCRTRIVGPHL